MLMIKANKNCWILDASGCLLVAFDSTSRSSIQKVSKHQPSDHRRRPRASNRSLDKDRVTSGGNTGKPGQLDDQAETDFSTGTLLKYLKYKSLVRRTIKNSG
jgi:hypothetical protein